MVSTLTIISERHGPFRVYFERDNQLNPLLNVRKYKQSLDLMDVLTHFKNILTNQLKQLTDEMMQDDNYDDNYYDNYYGSPFELSDSHDQVEEAQVEEAPEVIIIEDEGIIPVKEAQDVIIIEDEAIIFVD